MLKGLDVKKALPLFLQAAQSIRKYDYQLPNGKSIVSSLISCYEQLKQFDQAEIWRRKWLAVEKQRSGADSPSYASELAALGSNLIQQKKWSDAERLLRECLTIRNAKEPELWTRFNTQSMLGATLLGQRKYKEAEPLLLEGYQGMKQRADKIPPQGKEYLIEATQRLVDLYEALENEFETAKWRNALYDLKNP